LAASLRWHYPDQVQGYFSPDSRTSLKSNYEAHCGVAKSRNTKVLLRFAPSTASLKISFLVVPNQKSNEQDSIFGGT